MKKIVFVFALIIAASFSVQAQTESKEFELIQSLFGMEKKVAMDAFLELEESNAADFWKLYDQYELERKELGVIRMDLLNKYVKEYMDLDDATTESLIKESIDMNKAYVKLINTYYKKIKKLAGVKVAAQFYQVENYLLSYIRTITFSEIPFVGEIE